MSMVSLSKAKETKWCLMKSEAIENKTENILMLREKELNVMNEWIEYRAFLDL